MYPVLIRDILLWFAHYDLYTPKWSETVFEEWKRVMLRKEIPETEALKRIERVNKAFPDALVTNYSGLLSSLTLPAPDDRHVLAAAIKTNANVIVTSNLKDFPETYLQSFGLSAQTPDDFLTDLIDLNPEKAVAAFREMVLNKRAPPLDVYEVLHRLRNAGLTDSANYLHALI